MNTTQSNLKRPAKALLLVLLIGIGTAALSILFYFIIDGLGLQFRVLAKEIAYLASSVWALVLVGFLIWFIVTLFTYPQTNRVKRILQKTGCIALILIILASSISLYFISFVLFAFSTPNEDTIKGNDGVTYIYQYAPTDPVDGVPYYRTVNLLMYEKEPAKDIAYYETYTGIVQNWFWAGGDQGGIQILTVDVGQGKTIDFELKGIAMDAIKGAHQIDTGNRVKMECKRYSILDDSPYIITQITVL